MGKLVEATVLRYYGNRRIKPGEQFVMADSDFVGTEPVLDKDGKPVLEDGVPKMKESGEEKMPFGVIVVEEGYEDPVFESEAEIKAKQVGKPKKREAHKPAKAGELDQREDLGLQVSGQVRAATPAASSFVGADVAGAKPETGKDEGKKSSKSVI